MALIRSNAIERWFLRRSLACVTEQRLAVVCLMVRSFVAYDYSTLLENNPPSADRFRIVRCAPSKHKKRRKQLAYKRGLVSAATMPRIINFIPRFEFLPPSFLPF